jgi:hypothetical protein
MAGLHLFNINPKIQNDTRQEKLKFIQLNLQHSRLATDNITKIIEEETPISYASKSLTKSGTKSLGYQEN